MDEMCELNLDFAFQKIMIMSLESDEFDSSDSGVW